MTYRCLISQSSMIIRQWSISRLLKMPDLITQSLVLLALWSSPPQPAGLRNCNAAAFASFKKFADAFFESRLRRDRIKRCGLCSYWWKCETCLVLV